MRSSLLRPGRLAGLTRARVRAAAWEGGREREEEESCCDCLGGRGEEEGVCEMSGDVDEGEGGK